MKKNLHEIPDGLIDHRDFVGNTPMDDRNKNWRRKEAPDIALFKHLSGVTTFYVPRPYAAIGASNPTHTHNVSLHFPQCIYRKHSNVEISCYSTMNQICVIRCHTISLYVYILYIYIFLYHIMSI